jgi:hypothetical protein
METVDEQIAGIIADVHHAFQAEAGYERRFLIERIEIACRALVGQERVPDLGPWVVEDAGRTLQSDNFEHDVALRVTGDFYSDENRIAYAKELASRLNRP